MHHRCTNPTSFGYYRYGGRGIKVCDRWNAIENFDADMGMAPSPDHTLERIDSNGDYEPGNCCWATHKEQARNRCNNVLHEYQGKTYFLADLAAEKGISYRTLDGRIRRQGMSLEEALTTSTKPRGRAFIEVNGVLMSKSDAAKAAGISRELLHQRLSRGLSVEDALTKPAVITGRPPKT